MPSRHLHGKYLYFHPVLVSAIVQVVHFSDFRFISPPLMAYAYSLSEKLFSL